MTENHPLYQAVKQFTEDLRKLIELTMVEPEGALKPYISIAKEELNSARFPQCGRSEEIMYKALIGEVYDHLGALVESMHGMQRKYQRLATRDLLTGLYNRNYFNEVIVRDIERARRNRERLSFLLLDINNFKKINDTYGHLHGDGVLRECAQVLRDSIRKSDFLCRYGGDEFLIITQRADCAENDALVRRIEEGAKQWNKEYAILGYEMSFSIGCAIWQDGMDLLEVLHASDKAMYEDKKKRKAGAKKRPGGKKRG